MGTPEIVSCGEVVVVLEKKVILKVVLILRTSVITSQTEIGISNCVDFIGFHIYRCLFGRVGSLGEKRVVFFILVCRETLCL